MIFCPLPSTPTVTQGFGQNPDTYKQFGFQGHEGIDFGVPEGTQVYAPHDGTVTVKDTGPQGYGLHVIIQDSKRQSLLAHLSATTLKTGDSISQGDPVGKSGKSGMASGPHLHWTFKLLSNGVVQNKDNGYGGALDVSQYVRLWQNQNLYDNATYTAEALPYKALKLAANQQLQNPNRVA
jgi:murein DD-endopeptidase MepM/ murein hydrolase activator NlpD